MQKSLQVITTTTCQQHYLCYLNIVSPTGLNVFLFPLQKQTSAFILPSHQPPSQNKKEAKQKEKASRAGLEPAAFG
jgi:hypothetical protein